MNNLATLPRAHAVLQPWLPRARAVTAVMALATLGLGTAMASFKPIANIGVVIKKNPGGSVERVLTGHNGEFNFSNLGKGRYTVEVVPESRLGITGGDYDKASPKLARTRSGSELHMLQITLKPGQGRPLQLEITRDGGQITGTAQGDESLLQGKPPVTKGGATN